MSEGTLAQVLAGEATWVVCEGDCLEVLPTIPDRAVAHVITDPPYSNFTHGKTRRGASLADAVAHPGAYSGAACIARATDLGFPAITTEQMAGVAGEAGRLAQRWVLAFCDVESLSLWREAFIASRLEHVRSGLWVKLGAPPQFTGDRPGTGAEGIAIAHPKGRKRWNGGGCHAVWTHPIELNRGGNNERLHTTQKPLELMLDLVADFTDPDELILDAFAGSGTTGVACLRLGRRFIGIEKDPKYAAIARERLRAESQGLSLRDARAGQTSLVELWSGK